MKLLAPKQDPLHLVASRLLVFTATVVVRLLVFKGFMELGKEGWEEIKGRMGVGQQHTERFL